MRAGSLSAIFPDARCYGNASHGRAGSMLLVRGMILAREADAGRGMNAEKSVDAGRLGAGASGKRKGGNGSVLDERLASRARGRVGESGKRRQHGGAWWAHSMQHCRLRVRVGCLGLVHPGDYLF